MSYLHIKVHNCLGAPFFLMGSGTKAPQWIKCPLFLIWESLYLKVRRERFRRKMRNYWLWDHSNAKNERVCYSSTKAFISLIYYQELHFCLLKFIPKHLKGGEKRRVFVKKKPPPSPSFLCLMLSDRIFDGCFVSWYSIPFSLSLSLSYLPFKVQKNALQPFLKKGGGRIQ